MLPRRLRLRRSSDFRAVRKHGRRWASRLLVLNALPNELSHNRFGFVVGKRVGGAVVRNRVRRLMREGVREQLPRLTPGYDVVLIARAGAAGASYHELAEAMLTLFGRADLLGGV